MKREDSCPETTTAEERDGGDLAVEESVALYLNRVPTHTVTLMLASYRIFNPYRLAFMLTSNIKIVHRAVDLLTS